MSSGIDTDKKETIPVTILREHKEPDSGKNSTRRTGIDIIGDADWGTHFCQFYSTKQDLIDILVPYFKQGLDDNEFCMWITSEPLGATEAISALEKEEPLLKDFIKEGRIEILDYTEWYVQAGRFDAEKVLQGWVDKLTEAMKRGYDGLRLTGNTFWLEKKDWADFTAYEETVNSIIGNYTMLAICTYNLEKCSALEIMDVMSNHQFALAKREGRWRIMENSSYTKAERALAESEQKYTAIFDRSPYALALTKMPERTFTDVNNAFLDLFEFRREELIGKTSPDLNITDRQSQEKISALLNKNGFVRDFESAYRTKTGKKLALSLNHDWILIHGNKYLLTTIRDITDRKRAEEEARRTNELLNAVTSGTELLIATVDREFRYTYFNKPHQKELKRLTGKDIRTGMSLMEVLSEMPDQLETALGLWGRAFKGETVTQVTEFGDERRFRRHYQTRHTPIFDDNGEITGAGEVTADITNYMTTEEELRRSREDMAHAQEVANIGSWRLDIRNNVLTWSDENHRIFGIPKGTEMTYETFLETVHPDDRAHVDAQWKKGLAGEKYDIEHRIVADGRVKWVREKAYLEFDGEGALQGGFGITQDITERRKMQENLRRRTDIVEGINLIFREALSSHSEENFGKTCLESVLKITGSRFGFIGELGSDGLLHDIAISETGWDACLIRDKTGHRRPVGNFKIHGLYGKIITEGTGFFTNDPVSHPESIGTPDGHPGLNSFIGVPLKKDGIITGIIAAANNDKGYKPEDLEALEALAPAVMEAFRRIRAERNLMIMNKTLEQRVSERTQLAESRAKQLQTLAAEMIEAEENEKRRLAELLHDDLQQIIAAAKMQLESARKKLPGEPALEKVKQLLEESIEKSRRLSRELSPAVLNHAGLVAALKWLARQMDEQFGHHADIDIDAEDADRFENIPLKTFIFRTAQELLFNAVKHSGVKNSRIVLSVSGSDFTIKVSDHGKGFNPDMLNHSHKNTGIGLISLRERANYIGCNFIIESSPGQGSSFTLIVPLNMIKHGERRKPASRLQPKGSTDYSAMTHPEEIRVLFADDHAVIRQGLISLISGQPGITVIGEVSNGKEALEKARELKPDIIIMDISMPEMNGIEATQAIKSELPEIGIIGLSIHNEDDLAQRMREAGAETLISKTASSAELLKAIYGIKLNKLNKPTFHD